ncbi:MAG: hypothetical protein ACE367_20480 [Acidimicrobiales bacterium]
MTSAEHSGIRIEIEIQPGYQPPARVAAALVELGDALEEAAGDVAGYGFMDTVKQQVQVQPLPNLSRRLTNNEVIEGVFKF